MTGTDFTKSILALLAWREENINGINGMLGVCFLVRNRVNAKGTDIEGAGWGTGDYAAVIEAHNQFSSMVLLGDGQTTKYPDIRNPQFQAVLQAIDSIYDGTAPDTLTNGSLFYADLSSPAYVKGGWFDRNIANNPEKHPRKATIGSTTYFG